MRVKDLCPHSFFWQSTCLFPQSFCSEEALASLCRRSPDSVESAHVGTHGPKTNSFRSCKGTQGCGLNPAALVGKEHWLSSRECNVDVEVQTVDDVGDTGTLCPAEGAVRTCDDDGSDRRIGQRRLQMSVPRSRTTVCSSQRRFVHCVNGHTFTRVHACISKDDKEKDDEEEEERQVFTKRCVVLEERKGLLLKYCRGNWKQA